MRRLLLSITMLLFTVATSKAGNFGNQFVTAKLAYDASIDVPRSWHVMRGNEMRAIETAVGAAIDLSEYVRLVDGTESLIVSIFPDRRLYAGVTVTSTALRGSTRSSAATLSEAQLRSGELTIRQGMEVTLARLGGKAWGWTPLKTIKLDRTTVLHISYPTCVRRTLVTGESIYTSSSVQAESTMSLSLRVLRLKMLGCCRFQRHRVRCMHETGGAAWSDASLRESSKWRR